eukprot:985388-Rhodomonas_salina.2
MTRNIDHGHPAPDCLRSLGPPLPRLSRAAGDSDSDLPVDRGEQAAPWARKSRVVAARVSPSMEACSESRGLAAVTLT